MAEVKRGWRGEGRMTDDRRNIDGLVDLVLTRALVMSERQYGVGLSIVTVTDIVTQSVLCRHVRWRHVSTSGPRVVHVSTSGPRVVHVVAALVVQSGHLAVDLHLGAVGGGEVLEVQAGRQLPVDLVRDAGRVVGGRVLVGSQSCLASKDCKTSVSYFIVELNER